MLTRLILATLMLSALCTTPLRAVSDPLRAVAETPDQAAMRVLDEFLAAFNAEDVPAWRKTLHYPHVRMASGQVAIANTPEEYAADNTFERLRATGWDHSNWGERRIVQRGPDKVHVLVTFTRYDAANKVIGAFDSLYVVTLKDGHWGIQARSSFAP